VTKPVKGNTPATKHITTTVLVLEHLSPELQARAKGPRRIKMWIMGVKPRWVSELELDPGDTPERCVIITIFEHRVAPE
jgi:hypothetical protein